jgi:hypothetical protein
MCRRRLRPHQYHCAFVQQKKKKEDVQDLLVGRREAEVGTVAIDVIRERVQFEGNHGRRGSARSRGIGCRLAVL